MNYLIVDNGTVLARFDDPNKTDKENYNRAIVAMAKMVQKDKTTKAKIVQKKSDTLFDYSA